MTAPPDLLDDLVADGFAVRTITVDVAGDGAGEGPLTWAQADHWRGIVKTGQAATLSGAYQFPAGSTLDEQVELLRFVVSRHPALRTRLALTADGQVRQVCSATGQVTLWVVETSPGQHLPGVAHQVRVLLSARPFDYQHEFPIRLAAVLMPDGTVSQQVVVYLHMAVDAGGLSALLADLAARDPVTGAPAGPVTAVQPLQLAAKQASPAGQRQSAASLRHLERVLRTAEPAVLGQHREGPAEYQAFRYWSPATALALARIVQAQQVPAPSALLALFAMSLVAELGVDPVWTMVLVSNRFRPGLADSVSQLVQSSPFVLELGADCTFTEALARAQQGLLQTYKHAYYDGDRQLQLIERIERERGCAIQLGCYFNDRQDERTPGLPAEPASDDELRAALATSSWHDEDGPLPDVPLFVNVDHTPHGLEFPVSFDTRYLDREAAAAIVRGIETFAVRAAIAPDRPVLEFSRGTGRRRG
jgi:hypothetical protein